MSRNECNWGPLRPLKEKLLTWLEMLGQKAEQPVTHNSVSSGFGSRRGVVVSWEEGPELLWAGPKHSRPPRSWACCPRPGLCSSWQTRGLTPSPFPTISSPWEGNHLMVHWRRRKGTLEKCYDNRNLFSVGTIWCAGVTKEAVIECPGTPFGPR